MDNVGDAAASSDVLCHLILEKEIWNLSLLQCPSPTSTAPWNIRIVFPSLLFTEKK